MDGFRISPDELRRLARLVEENGLSELRYEEGGLRVTLRTGSAGPALTEHREAPSVLPGSAEDGAPSDTPALAEDVPTPALPANAVLIEAPVMGVFYRRPAPNEPPFVDIGDQVEAGQPVGMIEAMKVFSEVLSEVAGVVRDIPARNGALVQPGEILVVLEVLE